MIRNIHRIVAAVVVALVLSSAAPLALRAQEPAPVANTASQPTNGQTAQSSEGAAKPEAQEPSEEETFLTNGPTSGPAVRWLSKTLNVSIKAASNIFIWINFAVLFLGIVVPLVRVVPKALRNRRAQLASRIEDARKVTEEASVRLGAIEARLAGLDSEIAAIRQQVETESAGDEQRIKATIEDEKARIVAAAEQEINVAAAQASRNLRTFAADLAIEQAAKQLTLTAETDKALVAEFITSISKPEGGK